MLKKGFTLIELLGVIILLAIISLMATPIILNLVNDAQESADMTTAQLIVSSGHNYYAASLFDEAKKMKINNLADVYNEIEMTNKPTTGQLYVNNNDQVAMGVIINNKCYKKNFIGDIEIIGIEECDLGFVGQDEIAPTISQEVINTTINSNDWYKEDIYIQINVTDNESGVAGYKRCMSISECNPDSTIYNVINQIYINTESESNYVCVIGIDNYGNESDKECVIYKLDKTQPIINNVGDLTVNRNEPVDLSENVTYDDALSGIDGTMSITPSTIDTSVTGTKQVTYQVQDMAGNVKEVIRNIIVDAEAPTIVFSLVDSSAINSNGWAKSNFYIRATITDNSGSGIASSSSCTTNSSSECTPSAIFEGTTKDFYIESEGSNRACIQVTDNNNKTTKICSDTYNLDKTNPTAGTATFAGTLGSNDWYTTNVIVNKVNGADNLSGHASTTSSVSSITANTIGTTVTITTTDLAGNSASRNYTIKVDKNSPTLTAKGGVVEIKEGNSNTVSNYFTVSYSISGGSMSCTPTNTSGLAIGTRTLSCTATGGNGLKVTVTKSITVKENIYEDASGANKPELLNNMIPIKYNGSNWVYADISEEWYDYNSKEWANAVVLNSGVSKSVGNTISESEIALWYVWIPRYKYQLFNANNESVAEQLINIEFESETATTGTVSCNDAINQTDSDGNAISQVCTNAINGNWYTHPAFIFGTEQLTGFWMGKFEVSGNTSTITIKPGVISLRNRTISTFFTAIQDIKTTYNLSGDSHMIKNIEWGAVAYLKQSKYGLGTTDIAIDSSNNYYTGGGTSLTSYKSNISQATTGNIYGVYDMSSTTYEYVMANMVYNNGIFLDRNAGFGENIPNAKYYDKYTYGTTFSNYSRGKLGDATKETLMWYGDQLYFLYATNSWFRRGGNFSAGDGAGVFSFNYDINDGGGDTYLSTRAILTP